MAARELIIWRGSQYSNKVIAALHVKGLIPSRDYRVMSAPTGFEPRRVLLPAPHTVPVLRWDGEVVAGSDNICAFLDERIAEPPLYPPNTADEVRRLEKAAADLYWHNGWTSMCDPVGFERWSGARARSYIASGGAGAGAKFAYRALPSSFMNKIIQGKVQKDFLDNLRRRGGAVGERLVTERNAAKVLEEAREMLRALDAELQASASLFFCGAASPTAADLTLFGMLERWVGNSLCPGLNGAAQPAILDGMPGLQAAWDAMHARFTPDCFVHELGPEYGDITEPVGPATWPKPS